MVRRATKKSRAQQRRHEKKLIVVAAEGKNKTETTYLKTFNKCQNKYWVVPAKGNNTDASNIVDDAIKTSERLDLDFSFGDMAIALVDTDQGKETQLREARDKAQRNNVELLMSNPCFEVWLLQHFRYSTKGYINSDEVIEELKTQWPDYRKNLDDYSELIDATDEALKNAEKLRKHHEKTNSTNDVIKCNPETDVDKIARMLHEA